MNKTPEDEVGLGIDVVSIERMSRILARTPSFAARVFSEEERAYCDNSNNPAAHYACRFAAKEAVLKALGTGFSAGIGVRDVEVTRRPKGRPRVRLSGAARALADELGVRSLPLSLSFTHHEAVACALVITKSSLEAMEERVDPVKEMTKRFKEARSLLDELEARDEAAARPGSAASEGA